MDFEEMVSETQDARTLWLTYWVTYSKQQK